LYAKAFSSLHTKLILCQNISIPAGSIPLKEARGIFPALISYRRICNPIQTKHQSISHSVQVLAGDEIFFQTENVPQRWAGIGVP